MCFVLRGALNEEFKPENNQKEISSNHYFACLSLASGILQESMDSPHITLYDTLKYLQEST